MRFPMDKTELNESTQKNIKISAKQAEEIKISRHIATVLKREWEELAKKQEQRGVKINASRKISSITLTKNRHGKVSVQINMQNGARLLDNVREKNVISFKEKAQEVYSRAKVEELLKKIKEYGYAAVEGEIPAELKEAVLKAMEKANISTSYKGAKAEAEAARGASQRAAEDEAARENSQRAAEATNQMFKGMAGVAGFAAAHKVIGAENGYLYDGSGHKIKSTPRLEDLFHKNVNIFLPSVPDNIPSNIKFLVEEQTGTVLDAAAKSAEKIELSDIGQSHIGSMSTTAITKDGRIIKAEAPALATKNTVQKELLSAIELLQNGDDDRARKLLNTQLSVLKHNNIIPKESTEFPLDKLDAAREFFRNNASQLKERGAVQYFSEEGKKEYLQNKALEKEEKKRLQNEGVYEKNKEIRKEVAKHPTLLSEGIRKEDLSNYTFSDVFNDLKVHRKGGYQASEEERNLSYLLRIEQEKASLNKADKISADISKKCIKTLHLFNEEKRNNSQLDFKGFLEEKGIKPPEPKVEKRISANKAKTASNATKEALLAPDNAVSAEKIRQAKAVLDKEANGEPLSEKEQKLLNFVHQTFSKIPDLKKEDLEDPKNSKQLAQMLQCKKLYSNLPKEEAISKQAETSRPAEKPVAKQQSGNTMGSKPAEKPVAKQQSVPAAVQSNHPQQTKITEKERVISKIKENMETFKNASEAGQTPQEPETVKKSGLQQKIQQKQQTANSSVQQQTAKPSVQQQTGLSSAMRIALINKKERE